MAVIGKGTQQPSEKLDYDIKFDTFLPATDTIDSNGYGSSIPATALVEPSGLTVVGTPSMVVGADVPTNTRVKVWLTGGSNGVTYKVTVTVKTNGGRIKQDEFYVKVREY